MHEKGSRVRLSTPFADPHACMTAVDAGDAQVAASAALYGAVLLAQVRHAQILHRL